MGLQKFRADEKGDTYSNGAIPWYSKWIGGPTLAKLENCPTPAGPRTVYITGHADTFFSLPAACKYRGKAYKGWVGFEDGQPIFHSKDLESVLSHS